MKTVIVFIPDKNSKSWSQEFLLAGLNFYKTFEMLEIMKIKN